eukprot:NODE_3472_length_771_cov_61.022161_g2903_i0.p1 GENE.NODE_3472_length_771_cov_61.022161_g2903_i0~~NODE_3472_length_771_cov_61.022161_g2903_i0.p1  ORF type:complete len:231 (-),score=98.51 NODE_3472_length_771_cov_61.022161_g2903_i0:77-748(-)
MGTKIADITKTTTTQIIKLEDELSRLNMSKEVVVHESVAVKAELERLKADDGGKKIITQLQTQIEHLAAEKTYKSKETEEALEELHQKLAKQITENRLMRIQQKDSESDWARRVRKLEQEVVEALERLIGSHEEENVRNVEGFVENVNRSCNQYLLALREARDRSIGLTDSLLDIKSMHTNLPRRIKASLEELPKEELLLILDTLSFEESVSQYFAQNWPDNR